MDTLNEWRRKYRVLDMSVADIAGTFAGAYVLSRWMGWSFFYTSGALMLASYPIHKLTQQRTKTTENPLLLAILLLPPYPL
jgi:hypothetical protein